MASSEEIRRVLLANAFNEIVFIGGILLAIPFIHPSIDEWSAKPQGLLVRSARDMGDWMRR